VVHGETGAVNPDRVGTKAAANYSLVVQPGDGNRPAQMTDRKAKSIGKVFADFDQISASGFVRQMSSTTL